MQSRAFLTFLVAAGLAGCGQLPTEGPSLVAVQNGQIDEAGLPAYRVVELNETVLALINTTAPQSFSGLLYAGKPAAADRIGPGDVLAVSVFEAGSGGLFSRATAAGGTTNETLPRVAVDADGTFTMPFAGVVRVAGLTPREVSAVIEQRLRDKAIEPQVVVTVVQNVWNAVTVSGDVSRPGRVPITAAREKVLDGVALAGGTVKPAHDTFVQLTRQGKRARVLLKRIIDNPREDIYLWPGDQLHVTYEPRTFTVFGAAGKSAEYPFESERLSLVEGLARAGGLVDLQSDASAVFVFRYEFPEVAAKLGIDVPPAPNGGVPVIYRLNLLQPRGYFYGQSFMMREKDVIYVANAPAAELQKFLLILQAASSTARGVSLVTNPR